MGYILAGIAAFAIILGGAIYLDNQSSIPTQEEINNLNQALPEGCVVHDVGSYGKIDRLLIVECENSKVTSTFGYMQQQNGKSTEVDLSTVVVIEKG